MNCLPVGRSVQYYYPGLQNCLLKPSLTRDLSVVMMIVMTLNYPPSFLFR